jgi:hypothetical protein
MSPFCMPARRMGRKQAGKSPVRGWQRGWQCQASSRWFTLGVRYDKISNESRS